MICYQMVPAGSSSRIKAPIRKDLNPLLFWTRSYERATKWIFKPFEGFLVFVSNYLPFFICRSIFFYCFPFWRRGSTNLSKLGIKIITRTSYWHVCQIKRHLVHMCELFQNDTLVYFHLTEMKWKKIVIWVEGSTSLAPPQINFATPTEIFGHFGHIQFLKMPGFRQ